MFFKTKFKIMSPHDVPNPNSIRGLPSFSVAATRDSILTHHSQSLIMYGMVVVRINVRLLWSFVIKAKSIILKFMSWKDYYPFKTSIDAHLVLFVWQDPTGETPHHRILLYAWLLTLKYKYVLASSVTKKILKNVIRKCYHTREYMF